MELPGGVTLPCRGYMCACGVGITATVTASIILRKHRWSIYYMLRPEVNYGDIEMALPGPQESRNPPSSLGSVGSRQTALNWNSEWLVQYERQEGSVTGHQILAAPANLRMWGRLPWELTFELDVKQLEMFCQVETHGPWKERSMVCKVPAWRGPDGSGVVKNSNGGAAVDGKGALCSACAQAVTRD